MRVLFINAWSPSLIGIQLSSDVTKNICSSSLLAKREVHQEPTLTVIHVSIVTTSISTAPGNNQHNSIKVISPCCPRVFFAEAMRRVGAISDYLLCNYPMLHPFVSSTHCLYFNSVRKDYTFITPTLIIQTKRPTCISYLLWPLLLLAVQSRHFPLPGQL
jgi:hypothetical protein